MNSPPIYSLRRSVPIHKKTTITPILRPFIKPSRLLRITFNSNSFEFNEWNYNNPSTRPARPTLPRTAAHLPYSHPDGGLGMGSCVDEWPSVPRHLHVIATILSYYPRHHKFLHYSEFLANTAYYAANLIRLLLLLQQQVPTSNAVFITILESSSESLQFSPIIIIIKTQAHYESPSYHPCPFKEGNQPAYSLLRAIVGN